MSIVGMRNFMHGRMQYIMLALAVVMAIGMVGVMIGTGRTPTVANDTSGALAKINGDRIDRQAFELRYQKETEQAQDTIVPSAFQEAQTRGRLFDAMVDEILRVQMAEKAGVKVRRGEIKAKINEYIDMRVNQLKGQALANYKGKKTDQAFDAELRKSGMSIAQIKADMRKAIDPNTVREQVLIEKYYAKLKDGMDTSDRAVRAGFDEIRLAQITIGVGNRSAVQAEQRAKDVLAKVRAGEDFGKLAQQYSEDPYKAMGGDQGNFMKKSSLPDDIADAAFRLKAGEVGGPIQQPDGYVIFKVQERRSALPADFNDPKKNKGYRDMYLQQEQYRLQAKAENDMRKNASIAVSDPEIKAYLASKDIGAYLDPSGGTRAKAKAKEALKLYQAAVNASVGDSQALARCYSSMAYLYYLMSKAGPLSPTPQEKVEYVKKAIESFTEALNYTESNDLRAALADLYIENKDYDKALAQLKYVSDNEFYDKNVHMQIISKYEWMKSARPGIVAQRIADENRWIADYEKRMQESQSQTTQQTSKPFRVPPKPGG